MRYETRYNALKRIKAKKPRYKKKADFQTKAI